MTEQAAAPPLAVEGVSKSFPGVQALRDVSFDCRAGEIHALVGENGAGKSTLMRILAGVYGPDAGEVRISGSPIHIADPADARRLGIAMVYQDTRLIPDLDAAQNIYLGHEPGGLWVDYRAMRNGARAMLNKLGEDLDTRTPIEELSLAERQIIEIARALGANSRVLILDEPTSALTPPEVDRLFTILRDLRAAGVAIIFISHRLPEVFSISDRITVLKDGEIVGTVATSGTNEDAVVSMMVGRDLTLAFPSRTTPIGAPVLAVEDFSAPGSFSDVSFEIRAGEIVGFGGITGSGQQAIVRALYGLLAATGRIAIDGVPATIASPTEAIGHGIVFLPADRRAEGMFLPHSVSENIALPHIAEWAHLGIVDTARERKEVAAQIAALSIKASSANQPVAGLSGGNQQKVAFARWLLSHPKVCIFDEPTQGVDVGTKLEIYAIIRGLAARGIAVILVSSDVLELIGMSDRILIVANGRLTDEVAGAEATEERIIGSAVGLRDRKSEADAESAAERGRSRETFTSLLLRRYGAVILLAVIALALGAYAATQSPYFLTGRNMANLALQLSPLLIVSLGQFAVVLLGGIDLSTGPNISLTTALASIFLVADPPFGMAAGIAICLMSGAVIGAVNGVLVRTLKLPDLIATLATFSVVAGLALIIRPAPGGLVSNDFADAVLFRIGYVPVAFLGALAATILFEFLLLRGRIGLRLYAVGSSEESAYVAGIRTGWVRLLAYVACGLLAAIAGLIVAARIGSGDPQAGTNFTLLSITVVVLGGTSIFGGRGTALGILVAALLIMLIQNVMDQIHVSAYWQYVWTGVLTLLAVGIYALQAGAKRRPAARRVRAGTAARLDAKERAL